MLDSLFTFQVSPWELVVRGSLIYWFLFLLLRFVLRREAGSAGLADILVIVVIADAAQNGMAGEYKTVGEGFVLIGTIAGWNLWIDWMSFRFRWFARFAAPQVLPLVRRGLILHANLRRNMLTEAELLSALRGSGVENLSEVKVASLEPSGKVSVIRYDREDTSAGSGPSPHS